MAVTARMAAVVVGSASSGWWWVNWYGCSWRRVDGADSYRTLDGHIVLDDDKLGHGKCNSHWVLRLEREKNELWMEERLEIIEARMGLHVFRNYSAFCNIWNGCVPVSYVEHEQCNWYLDQLNYNPNVLIPASGNSTIKYAHRPTTNQLSVVRRDRANRNTQLLADGFVLEGERVLEHH